MTVPFRLQGSVLLSFERVGLAGVDASGIGRVNSSERVRMETWFSVLALILGVAKVTIMWLSYKENKRQKDTDCDK